MYLSNDLDYLCACLCACQTAPYQSWRNPAEMVMSCLNIGLQYVGLMREQMPDEQQLLVTHCNNLSQLCSAAKKSPDLIPAVLDSIEPVKVLLSTVFQRLELCGKKFSMFSAASKEKLQELWYELSDVDLSLEYDVVYCQSALKELPALTTFLDHCFSDVIF